MDGRANRRNALPIGVSRRGTCFSGEQNHEAQSTHYPTRIGGSTRVTAVKANRIEDKELGESSKIGGRLSSSKSLLPKSASAVPKLGTSSSSNLKKTRKVQPNSAASGQSSSTRNLSAGLGQKGQVRAAFHKGEPSNSSRLGLSEISNLTSSEGSTSDLDFLQETPTSSMSRSLFRSGSTVERRDNRVVSSRFLNRQGSWNDLELLNVNSSLSDLMYGEHEHNWTGIEENGTRNIGAGPSLRSGLMNDAAGLSIFENDHESVSDDSFVSAPSVAEDLFDVDVASSSDSLLQSSPLLSQRAQDHGNFRRPMLGHADNPHVSLGEVVNMSTSSLSKRKAAITRAGSQIPSKTLSQEIPSTGSGSASKDRYSRRPTSGTSRRNLGNFGCTSASDALPFNVSSSSDQIVEQPGNRRLDLGRKIIDGHDSARSRRLTKVPLVTNTGGPVPQRTIRAGAGIGPRHMTSKTNSTSQASRRTVRAMQPGTYCSLGILGGDSVVELAIPTESSSNSMPASDQSGLLCNGLEVPSPSSFRGRSAHAVSQRQNEVLNVAACTSGERVASRFAGSNRRGTSSSAASARLFGLAGSSSRLNNTCTDTNSSSHNLLSEDNVGNNTLIISTPAPSRAPPVPPGARSGRSQANASLSTSLSFSGSAPARAPPTLPSSSPTSLASSVDTSYSSFLDGLVYGRSGSGNECPAGRPMVANSEVGGRRSLRNLPIENGSQTRYTIEGLAEVLLALERIEHDEELTYEQVLMLEANLLFGGINLPDQHSDMRLDIDNMSYEELLALEERIGSVNTGLTEDAVSKCLTRFLYTSDVAAATSTSQESEVKCSVCQEEYEERDELGRLNCDHSYHAACIKQWLLQKNQCPICKAPAAS